MWCFGGIALLCMLLRSATESQDRSENEHSSSPPWDPARDSSGAAGYNGRKKEWTE